MYSLNIGNELVSLKDMGDTNFYKILNLYNTSEDFAFATGVDKPISIIFIKSILNEIQALDNEFFVGIYPGNSMEIIGMLRGKYFFKDESFGNVLWISSIAIDVVHRRKGYGRETVDITIDHFKREHKVKRVYLVVDDKNEKGKVFWRHLGFSIAKQDNFVTLKNKTRPVILMCKIV